MRIIKKIFKLILLTLVGLILAIVIISAILLKISPQFGKAASKVQQEEYAKTSHFKKGRFSYQIPTTVGAPDWDGFKKMIKGNPRGKPGKAFQIKKLDPKLVFTPSSDNQFIWFGHSTFLLKMDGKNILLDPMFGGTSGPFSWLGPKRYYNEFPLDIEQMPFIDAVIISHDHYDHLDYGSIQKLKGKVGHFYVPLGVANHLLHWGIAEDKISEFDWWDETSLDGIKLVCAPARHFSGRRVFDRNTTLWCSWIIKGKEKNIYFSGDSGYGPHFKKIGDKFGPFDIALMECGQYNLNWHLIHLLPEETVQATVEVSAKVVMPIHWGAFTLAMHDWDEPPIRLLKKAAELNVLVSTPHIGEIVDLDKPEAFQRDWWTEY